MKIEKDIERKVDNNSRRKFDNTFYKIMAEALGEEIFVTDGEGRVLFVNPASSQRIGLPVDKIIGKHVKTLEEEGYFSKSCTMEVIKTRKQVDLLQKLKDGRTLIATGVPIFDNHQEEIIMIVTTSKDVKSINELVNKVEVQEEIIEKNKEEIQQLRNDILESVGFIIKDSIMEKIVADIIKIAPLDVAVLVCGETGVGKEVIVRTLHRFSDRKDRPLVKINCGIIPENLIESELFGYERGAFTGAERTGKIGKVELAEGGILFLDEIGELPLTMQVKLLDLLQDGNYTRVGGTEVLYVNTRVVAATNRNLKKMCAEGKFRKDLYYRLNVIPINIPPLRERLGDIEVLSKHFLSKFNSKISLS
ncbi:sigma-54 interaction domain-containing protein [Anaerovorax sp. IOR16]|uniref:sigma-54 interaction domain-containing protein n=1 Tax=Anaerovorax sp. IOR16 TaxID=2773458 RepID=UPI0019D2B8B1|nr:sigma 54-interacting transcriptional regulator [Anaerovorax sp. IOR16]